MKEATKIVKKLVSRFFVMYMDNTQLPQKYMVLNHNINKNQVTVIKCNSNWSKTIPCETFVMMYYTNKILFVPDEGYRYFEDGKKMGYGIVYVSETECYQGPFKIENNTVSVIEDFENYIPKSIQFHNTTKIIATENKE